MITSHRNLAFPNLLNARDLGGCPTRDGQLTRWRSLVRSDDLSQLTPDGIQALRAYGVQTVIDLRSPTEVELYPSIFQQVSQCVQYIHISLLGPSEETWRQRGPEVPKVFWNCAVLDRAQPEIAAVLHTIAQASSGGLLFHCVAGKDRTGLLAALLLTLADVDPMAIVEDYVLSTERLREARLAAYPEADRKAVLESVHCPPEQIQNMLIHLDHHYGGPASYLSAIGVRSHEVQRIRARLRTDGASS